MLCAFVYNYDSAARHFSVDYRFISYRTFLGQRLVDILFRQYYSVQTGNSFTAPC